MIRRGRRSRQDNSVSRAEHDRIITLVNSLTDAVLSTDKDGIVTIYNAAAMSLLDVNAGIHGRHINDLLQLTTLQHQPLDVFRQLSRSPAIRVRDDILMLLKHGDKIRLEATFAPILGGHSAVADGYVLILRDITKAKSLEQERDEFISVVSHELRTPVAVAEGALDNARLLAQRGYTRKVYEALQEAHRQVVFLARMINDLGTLSRTERGLADAPEVIDLIPLVKQLHETYAPQAAAKSLAFNLDIDPQAGSVYVSRLYLEELLQNFITNAIKYTPRGAITLIVRRQQTHVTISVKDTGIGIGKSDLNKIFDRFYRAEDYRTRQTSGTGLGLYIARKLAQKLETTIHVTSRLNHGSTFSFTLPIYH